MPQIGHVKLDLPIETANRFVQEIAVFGAKIVEVRKNIRMQFGDKIKNLGSHMVHTRIGEKFCPVIFHRTLLEPLEGLFDLRAVIDIGFKFADPDGSPLDQDAVSDIGQTGFQLFRSGLKRCVRFGKGILSQIFPEGQESA